MQAKKLVGDTLQAWLESSACEGHGGVECYLKCMVCGRKLRVVHSNHLMRHGLTVENYTSMFPEAKIYSERYVRSLKRNFWKGVGKRRNRRCVECGSKFTTNSPNKVRCDLCQRIHRLETLKRRERMRRKFRKAQRQILGTKDQSTCLKVLPNGRVAGALWLEKRVGGKKVRRLFNGDGQIQCSTCESTFLMMIIDGQPYCTECGGTIVVARENEHYSATEICCGKCGLVYETPMPLRLTQ
ncbi:MAG: hypothetical protein QXL91_04950 [Candidatus Bathyarchaeia archaeon]